MTPWAPQRLRQGFPRPQFGFSDRSQNVRAWRLLYVTPAMFLKHQACFLKHPVFILLLFFFSRVATRKKKLNFVRKNGPNRTIPRGATLFSAQVLFEAFFSFSFSLSFCFLKHQACSKENIYFVFVFFLFLFSFFFSFFFSHFLCALDVTSTVMTHMHIHHVSCTAHCLVRV